MNVAALLASLEASALATRIRDSLYLFPLIESTHVIGLSLVFGTIAVVDLRLLGVASTRRPFSRIAADTFKWTWAAFALTVATGLLMFITNAGIYYHNTFFRMKMAMLVCAGINVLIFDRTAARSIQQWDRDRSAPPVGRTVAALSLAIWIAVIFLGRWIGFTTTQTDLKTEPDVNIEGFLPSSVEEGGARTPR